MQRRVKRDMIVLVGVAVVLTGVVFANMTFSRTGLAKEMDAWRRTVEREQRQGGIDLMSWPLLRKTTGSFRKGPTYDERLRSFDGQKINIVGFMVPENEFREVTHFILLPLPIECYFCERPPLRDVMFIQLNEGEATHLYKNPMVINGTLQLNEEAGTKYFYSIVDATVGAGDTDEPLEKSYIKPEHMTPRHAIEGTLMEGMEPPKPATIY